jgi:aspartate kinase
MPKLASSVVERAAVSEVTYLREKRLYEVADGQPARLFTALAAAGINVDMILGTGRGLVFSAPDADQDVVARRLDAAGASWHVRDDLGEVAVVGAGFKSHPGVAARAFEALTALGLNPEIVSTSAIRIACHLPRRDVERAARQLRRTFGLAAARAG